MTDLENSSDACQYLTYRMDKELFALEITQVREVLEVKALTKLPHSPDFMRGVINLRGHVVPVADLKLKFGRELTEFTIDTRIVIVEVTLDDELLCLGILADSVEAVTELEPSQIEEPPKMGSQLQIDFIKAMGKQDDEFIIILDIDRVFSAGEIDSVQQAGQGTLEPPPAADSRDEVEHLVS